MRKTFARLDDALIERLFQPLSDLFSHRAGVSRGAAACICIDLASLSWIISRLPGLSDAVVAWDSANAFLDLSLLLLGLVALMSLRMLFRRAEGKQGNPLRLAMRPHRAIVLLMLAARLAQPQAPDLGEVADIAMLLCAASALYLGACVERPPVRRGWAALVLAG
ncbi:MAG: hypothetical protein QOH05_1117 [Acetobacteraceae bacterium]|jgi:hypothetical protein|nr:hypothetical protein [Acetobacteraceae bacterium]